MMSERTVQIFVLVMLCEILLNPVSSVERHKFKTCQQSSFCKRARAVEPGSSPYSLDMSTLTVSSTMIEAVLINENNGVQFRLEIFGLKDSTFRARLREAFPLSPRFEVPEVLVGDPEQSDVLVQDSTDAGFKLVNGDNHVVVRSKPFAVDFYSNKVLVLSANARGLLKFEHYRNRGGAAEELASSGQGSITPEPEEPDMWEETFSGTKDSKPKGPSAIAMDFTFVSTSNVYGIPEHADHFSLSDTSYGDPYRLYNLDVFEYEVWNPMALYASIPFMMGHSKERTTGLFWLNAAETWVDVKKEPSGVLSSISSFVGSGKSNPHVDTHWISESGVMDFFVLLGPKPKDVSRQYGLLTGNTPLPPQFSLAYHQCRWNYNDEDDVKTVNGNFDIYDIPMDVMWLDIEHTDGKKYFTWDDRKFPNSLDMIANLTNVGRKLVTIVDPHIKKDKHYWVHKELTDLSLYVKTKDGGDYEGWCWPGASYYPDFLNPDAREYFSEQYMLDKYKGTTLDVFTWNDMNEPSVFNGPEVTMPKDIVHYGGWEHRDVHNLYGHLYVMGTFEGHLRRSENHLRPFILTRSAFAGTQRYAAIWTGDNTAEWKHLEASVPMCLSLSISGMSFCGADVGGFFNNPDGPLFVRWYQAAAFQPFFRSHAHIDTKRREPWLYSESELKLIRKAIQVRYSYLPLWYTLFYEGEVSGTPPMRPLWYEFPEDEGSFKVENQHMVGDSLLVRIIYEQGVTSTNVYFPGGANQAWYDIVTGQTTSGNGAVNVPVQADRIPVYQRGGSIVPKKERMRRSSSLMKNDPYTLIVALDSKQSALGTLYMDDGETYNYRNGEFTYVEFNFEENRLTSKVKAGGKFDVTSWIERIVIMGLTSSPRQVMMTTSDSTAATELEFTFASGNKMLILRKPAVNTGKPFQIQLNY